MSLNVLYKKHTQVIKYLDTLPIKIRNWCDKSYSLRSSCNSISVKKNGSSFILRLLVLVYILQETQRRLEEFQMTWIWHKTLLIWLQNFYLWRSFTDHNVCLISVTFLRCGSWRSITVDIQFIRKLVYRVNYSYPAAALQLVQTSMGIKLNTIACIWSKFLSPRKHHTEQGKRALKRRALFVVPPPKQSPKPQDSENDNLIESDDTWSLESDCCRFCDAPSSYSHLAL